MQLDLSRLSALGFGTYKAYLASAHWQEFRRRYWASGEPKECICGETQRLQLHHLTYERLGEELLSDVTPLCGHCHTMIHTLVKRGELGLDFAGFVSAARAQRYREQMREPEIPATPQRAERELAKTQGLLRAAFLSMAAEGRDTKPLFMALRKMIGDQRRMLGKVRPTGQPRISS